MLIVEHPKEVTSNIFSIVFKKFYWIFVAEICACDSLQWNIRVYDFLLRWIIVHVCFWAETYLNDLVVLESTVLFLKFSDVYCYFTCSILLPNDSLFVHQFV